ncbi:MAG: bifunctional UDP-N-acetylglucosamine diphosphorylase/glucosamine-1-phosphate N-acetyltransferase GlmU [Rickettsiales bacterium]|nr:bifunctional UDP-N-acetylglucosamine diphosphorylase/glucosamine-1-phosphate N-acetyltransferase GlmU [Rickettsiales bacterium]
MNLSIIILAAGKGTRMKSDLPKVMHKVAGREMLNMVIDVAKKSHPQNIAVVISEEMEKFKEKIIANHTDVKIYFIVQKERKGTAHALQTGIKALDKIAKKLVVLYGDTPLISHNTIEKMIEKINNNSLCVLGFNVFEENSYGRLVVENEHLARIVEYKDATSEERKITLCNSGVVAIKGEHVENLLSKVDNKNAAGEFYLTDIVGIADKMGLKSSFIETSGEEVLGVNSRVELARIETIKQNQIRKNMMESGVTLFDPASTYFSFDTKIAAETIIHPQVFFGENVNIASGVEVRSFCHIEGAKIESGAVVGPFARIRPGTEIEEDVRIGNFVEIKKSKIKKAAKVNHLSYVGDSYVGASSNIGAGTITCNYDGYNKFKTKIGENVFIGSNSALVAPVEIKDGAVIGAGSVITKDVEKDELAVARTKQINLVDGGKKYHKSKNNKK